MSDAPTQGTSIRQQVTAGRPVPALARKIPLSNLLLFQNGADGR